MTDQARYRRGRLTGRVSLTVAMTVALMTTTAQADWPNFRGPNHDGTLTGAGLANYSGKPSKVWEKDVGIGAGSVAVADGKLVVLGNIDDHEVVSCFDAKTGEKQWTFKYPVKFTKRMFTGGSATTPTIDDGHVYVLSEAGPIHCLKLSDGSKVWEANAQQYGGATPKWNYSASPVIVGNNVILNIGGSGNSTLALNKKTGAKVWGVGSRGASYGTPLPFQHRGKTFIAVAKAKHYEVLDASNGRELAAIDFTSSWDVNSGTPSFAGGKLFISNGYGNGRLAMFDLNRGGSEAWSNSDFAAKYCSPVLHEGHFYGISGERRGKLTCVRASDGKTMWQGDRMGDGTLIIVDGMIVALSEGGRLMIAPAKPTEPKPVVSMDVIPGRTWVEPVVSDGMVFVKNNEGALAGYKLK